jgi:hypothetical protein
MKQVEKEGGYSAPAPSRSSAASRRGSAELRLEAECGAREHAVSDVHVRQTGRGLKEEEA